MDPRIGTRIASYRIEALIGRGGMSVVYLAEDIRLKRKVALKLLSPELAQSEKFRDRFVRESELAASLDHPNIIPIFEAGEAGGVAYIAMRYVEGTDLGALIETEGRLEPERAMALLTQAASALDAAHSRGLIHRDVKPGNMLIAAGSGSRGQEHLYLSDFGVTKRATSDSGLTGTGQFVGTLDYAAPEQFEGKALDARTDVYSLGCVVYQCLTGKVPFDRDTQAALVYAHLMAPPPKVTERRPEAPEAIDDVVARAMAKSPEDRYPSAGDLIHAAREVLTPAAALGPSGPPHRDRRPLLLGAAVALVALVVLVVDLLARSGGRSPTAPASPSAAALAASDRVVRISQAGSQASLAKTSSLKVGKGPSAVVAGEGSVWVANQNDGTVSRIDPVTNETREIDVGREPVAIALGEGSVWVANRLSRSVSRIDPGTDKVVATIELSAAGFPSSIAVGEGGVWVLPSGFDVRPVIERIDTSTNRVSATIQDPSLAFGVVTTGAGAVWAAGNDGRIIRIDPKTNELRLLVNLHINVGGILVADGSLWVGSRGGVVLRIDPETGAVEATAPGGGSRPAAGPGGAFEGLDDVGMTFGNGIVWLTGKRDGTLDRILVGGNTALDPINVGRTPTAVAFGYGSVWVTVDAEGTS